MPEKETIERARRDKREGKAASTQAGEFVREEMHHVREGKHGARSPEQAIAIGLSKARRSGVKLSAPKRGKKSTKESAKRDLRRGASTTGGKKSSKRATATRSALKREGRSSASTTALSRHSRTVARKRSASSRSAAAKKAARTRSRHR
ncbi:MAG TPA: DNA-binding protein [Thermoanaerobaculia bacterium]